MAQVTVADLVAGVPGATVSGDRTTRIAHVRDDSRLVGPGDLFVAVGGTREDGKKFISDALKRGAAAILCEADALPAQAHGVAWIAVPDTRRALAQVAARYFSGGAELTLTAITGTNGKTTTTYLVEAILEAAGRRPGVVGTISYRFAGNEQPAPLTTPGALALHELLAGMRDAGCTDVVLEASSHALHQQRLAGCRFRVAALTNVTQDHLDYHKTMDEYFAAKEILFRDLLAHPDGMAVLFADREDGRRMRGAVPGAVLTVAMSIGVKADVIVGQHTLDEKGTRAKIATPSSEVNVVSPLVGDYNLSNIALAVGIACAHGIAPAAIERGIAAVAGVPGRLQRVANDSGVLCLVDYAHTPDALERALAALRPLTAGRLIVVFGCGGDRDKSKRPLMGRAAAGRADLTFVTSDNPRTEDAASIVEMIVEGMRHADHKTVQVEIDRRAAIARAVAEAQPGDTLLIAGKGHEDYQIVGAARLHFDDREEAAAAFARKSRRHRA